jgi:amidohydrolase
VKTVYPVAGSVYVGWPPRTAASWASCASGGIDVAMALSRSHVEHDVHRPPRCSPAPYARVMADLASSLVTLVDHERDAMVDTRRDLHRHPELGFEEHRTTRVVTDRLDALGLRARNCPTPTGAVYELEGGRPGATVLLRADIDALPVQESERDDVASDVEGRMHACGHDAHTAAMLGVAAVLAQRQVDLPGRYVFVFQPAEESLGGGKRMVEGGVLDGLDATAAIGCHVTSMAPVGLVALRDGVLMSEVRSFGVRALGAGGHGATAGAVGNVLLAVAQLASELEAVVQDMVHDGTACACSAGMLNAGTAPNVVPSTGSLRGTLRTFTPEQSDGAIAELRARCTAIGAAYACELELTLGDHAPAVVNDPRIANVVRDVAAGAVGSDHVLEIPPVTPSDDVSEFLNRIPGCYFFVGAARLDGTSGPHHSPTFAIDEGCLGVAAKVLATAAVQLAGGSAPA